MLAARHQAKDPKRLVLAYRQEGFCQMGGLFRIAQEVVTELRSRQPSPLLATLTSHQRGNYRTRFPAVD